MSIDTETLKKLIPLVRVFGGGRIVYRQCRTPARRTDTLERLHAVCNAVTAVTGTLLVIRALRSGDGK